MSDELPDVVGQREAAEILNTNRPQITRWRNAGKMPRTVADTAATPVWVREDVEAKARGATEFPDRERIPFVSTAEVAVIFDVDKSQIGRWRRNGEFPEPDRQVAAGPLWLRPTVKKFTPPGRRRKNAA